MTQQVDFYFDVGSPASYLAWSQLPEIARRAGAVVHYKPMLLGGIFKATGNSSPAAVPAKSRYMKTDLARHARRYGVPLVHNPHFPVDTLFLMRLVTGIQLTQPDRLQPLLACLFDAMWVQALKLDEPKVTAAALAAAGFDSEQALALAQQADVKAALRAVTDEAIARGVFGAPTCFVGDEMFFGQDRLDFVRESLA